MRGRRYRILITILWCVLAAASTVCGTPVFAQDEGTGVQSPPFGSAANLPVPSDYNAPIPNLQLGAAETTQPPLNATLEGQPEYGTAPLTVDFYVGLTNPQSSLVYQWNFGDGAVSSMKTGAYMPHTYQQSGTYLCSVTLMTPQGRSTTLVTTIIVQPRQS
jgi:PKD repeat protein